MHTSDCQETFHIGRLFIPHAFSLRRCVQTTQGLVDGLGQHLKGKVRIDNGLVEVCSHNVIKGSDMVPTDSLTLPLPELKVHCSRYPPIYPHTHTRRCES